jgi:hypothetical protein
MSETLSQYRSRVEMEDDAMSRGFRHDREVEAGRVEFILEPPSWGTRWSVDMRSSEGRNHYSGWFASREEAEQFIIKRKLELGIEND